MKKKKAVRKVLQKENSPKEGGWLLRDSEAGKRLGGNSVRAKPAEANLFTCNRISDRLLVFLRDAPVFSQGFLF